MIEHLRPAKKERTSPPHPQTVPFSTFLRELELQEIQVARLAHVHSLSVWRMTHGLPVKKQTANRVIVAIYQYKKRFYDGSVATLVEDKQESGREKRNGK